MITSLQWGMVHLFGFLPKHAFMAIHHFLNVLGGNVLESVIGIVLKFHFQVKSKDQARMIDCFEMLVHVHASSSISCHPFFPHLTFSREPHHQHVLQDAPVMSVKLMNGSSGKKMTQHAARNDQTHKLFGSQRGITKSIVGQDSQGQANA